MALKRVETSPKFASKLAKIHDLLAPHRVVVAFSGGIDSTLMAYLALTYARKMLAVFIKSALTPSQEISQALQFSKELGFECKIVEFDALNQEDIAKNSPMRCYFCKHEIISILRHVAEELDFDLVVDGTNYSDLTLPRPGLKALEEGAVLSPLALAHLSKNEIIGLSSELSLPSADIASQACLASRIPFHVPLTEEALHMVDAAEIFIRERVGHPTQNLRVRLQTLSPEGSFLARIEVDPSLLPLITSPQIQENIVDFLNNLGFTYVTIDLGGFQSGSMHAALEKTKKTI